MASTVTKQPCISFPFLGNIKKRKRSYPMYKITYHVNGLFSLKNYKDGHLLARSYPYVTNACIRGAILSAMIQRFGVAFSESAFADLKSIRLYPQIPAAYRVNQIKKNMISNPAMEKNPVAKTPAEVDSSRTVGIREFVHVDEVVFYMERLNPEIVECLENISVLGASESVVELKSIEQTDCMENVLMTVLPEEIDFEKDLHENIDWKTKLKGTRNVIDEGLAFSDAYCYSKQRVHRYEKQHCQVMKEVYC